jgi:hypothetical protein
VFGPDRPKATQKQLDRSVLRLVRSRAGVITAAELVQHTALTSPEAEEEMARLLGSYDGEAAVSPDGELVYAFPQVMTSAHGRVTAKEPHPAWLRLEYPLELTGNTTGANALVAGINGFNLLAAVTAPWFIFPRLGIGGPAAFVGLVLVPVVFSVLFFGLPLLRMLGVKLENRRRATRNVRRVLLGLVYRRSLGSGQGVDLDEAHRFVASRLENDVVSRESVELALHELAAEWEGDVSVGDAGELRFNFPAIRKQFAASETVRQRLQLDKRTLGDIVFSTSDTSERASERDLALFDGALEGRDVELSRYLPSADRIAFEDDYEVVAFDEQLKLSGRSS